MIWSGKLIQPETMVYVADLAEIAKFLDITTSEDIEAIQVSVY